MALEIERKFLIKKQIQGKDAIRWLIEEGLIDVKATCNIHQWYLLKVHDMEFRMRQTLDHDYNLVSYLTVKKGDGLVRKEEEIVIPNSMAECLCAMGKGKQIRKTRYKTAAQPIMEIDLYHAPEMDCLVAEIEFSSLEASQIYQIPSWIYKEVTGNKAFSNYSLASQ